LCCAGLFLLLGMLPLSSRPAAARGRSGAALVIANLALLAAASLLTLWRGFAIAPWSWIVVIAGLLLLVGPFLLQPMAQSIRDGRVGLAALLLVLLLVIVV
jgi:hypothetical protein